MEAAEVMEAEEEEEAAEGVMEAEVMEVQQQLGVQPV